MKEKKQRGLLRYLDGFWRQSILAPLFKLLEALFDLLVPLVVAEIINVDARYLANIENDGTIPSLPVVIQLIKECGLPVERYFNPEIMREESAQRQRVSHKLKLCPEQYLPIIEGAIDGAIQINNPKKKKETGDV